MTDLEHPTLPAGQVTPALPSSPATPPFPLTADDESPTTQIVDGDQPWRGHASVPRRPEPDTRDIDYEPEPSILDRWRARRLARAANRPALVATPRRRRAPPAAPPAPSSHPATYAWPVHRQRPPPGYAPPPPPGYPPAQYGPGQLGPRQLGPARYGPARYGPPPPPRRRRRKWPWFLLFMFAATAACCGGVYSWAMPFVDQYPASIATDADVPGLSELNDPNRREVADELLGMIESEQLDEQSQRFLFTDRQRRATTALVTTRFIQDPDKDLGDRFVKLTDRLDLGTAVNIDPGPAGGHQRCARGGRNTTVCGWADHGSLAIVIFGDRSVDESTDLLTTIRGALILRQ